ncbi:MAG: AcrR family transcriptional regulator [Dinoroseobacter sp.]|jgi:AcrR family transcriptional regulator
MMPISHAADPPVRRRRKTARPTEIVVAAFASFVEHGYAGTKLDEVAKRAGIAKGTVYLYFDTKQDLFEAVIRKEVSSVIGDIEAMVEAYEGPSEELLRQIITHAYSNIVLSDTRYLLRIIIGEGQKFPELCKLYYESSIKQAMALIRKVMQRGLDQGEFRQGPMTMNPQLLMSPCIMAAIWSMTFDASEPLDIDTYMAGHIDLILNDVLADKGS